MSGIYRSLPDGSMTKSTRKYISEWRRLCRVIEDTFDANVIGFDPGFSVVSKSDGHAFDLPTWAAKKLCEKGQS